MNCLVCLLVATEREVAALKKELDTAHNRLIELESQVMSENVSHHSSSVELGRAKERIVSFSSTDRSDEALTRSAASDLPRSYGRSP